MKQRNNLFVWLLLTATLCLAEELPVTRLAQVSLRVNDLAKARDFYGRVLGLDEAFSGEQAVSFKVNDDQFLEFRVDTGMDGQIHMERVSLLTPDLQRLRAALRNRRLKPGDIHKESDGNPHLSLTGPDGTSLDFVEYTAGSRQSKARGKAGGAQPVSTHLQHAALYADNQTAAMSLYVDKLGFWEIIRGPSPSDLRWINLMMPGTHGDYIELMVRAQDPPARRQHICFAVPDIQKAYRLLQERGAPGQFKPFLAGNGRWILNLRDSYRFRVEIMEERLFEAPAVLQVDREAEDRRVAETRAKRQRGERLSLQESDAAASIIERRNQEQAAKRYAEYAKANPPRESTGLVPLPDLAGGTYHGERGGLYPNGANTPPRNHLEAGLGVAGQITPLDRQGRPAPDGRIVVMSVGMSNTTQEYRSFLKIADDDTLNPKLVLVDGADGGQTAARIADPDAQYWNLVSSRIEEADVTPRQVQVVWIKEANGTPKQPFPAEAKKMEGELVSILHNLHNKFPNLKLVYLSSRTYAGYAGSPLNPEPHAYEGGFAVKWVIARQIDGDPELNYDPAKGAVRAPWIAWGPYLWTDGVKGRKDGFTWRRQDCGPDGTHPSILGREKVARLLLEFLKEDLTSQRWFLAHARAPDVSELREKVQSGQALTPDESQMLQRVGAQRMEQRRRQYMREHPPQPSTGLVALTDLGAGTYKGEDGGLYPGGKNAAPPEHLGAGLKLAREIVPLDSQGHPSANGKIVLLSIGFSNPNMEFPVFQKRAAEDPAINPRLVTVNGCVGGQASNVIANPQSNYWKIVDQGLSDAGVSGKQVEALWIKLVFPGPTRPFPVESKRLYHDFIGVLHTVHGRFPNLKVAYLSSRTYGGYTEVGGSPEPWAYETGFSVKWVVSDQITGSPEVNYDPARGPVRSPWIAWGPYLWTDGVKGRKDGFVFLREDLRKDGLHPSEKGQAKIAALMMNFFKTHPTTRSWFLAKP